MGATTNASRASIVAPEGRNRLNSSPLLSSAASLVPAPLPYGGDAVGGPNEAFRRAAASQAACSAVQLD